MKRKTLVAILLAVCVTMPLALAQQGPIKFRIPDDLRLPFYARIAGTTPMVSQEIYHNDEWAAIVFYYDPASVPSDFNLLQFYDFNNFPPGQNLPMTVAGFVLWDRDAMAAFQPWFQEEIHGLGAVPVWFVSWPELRDDAIGDGVLTVAELESLGSLRKGAAAIYQEVLHPLKHITINAEGLLEDGKSFQFHAAGSADHPPDCCYGNNVIIRIR